MGRFLRLGVIGFSEGNGHPYSWSAICNGYDPKYMANCEYLEIKKYLAEQIWPYSKVTDVQVTHIWTQKNEFSHKIAKACKIKNVVLKPSDMIGYIDGLLLARDDAENHINFAKPFLEAEIPVYIDKPVALSLEDLEEISNLEKFDGQIFSCSALRYAKELVLSRTVRDKIGPIKHIEASTPKSWKKYSIHIIEPVLKIVNSPCKLMERGKCNLIGNGRSVFVSFENGITANFTALGDNVAGPIFIRVHGEAGWHDLTFFDSFSAFKAALNDFCEGVRTRTCRAPYAFNNQVVSIIEAGVRK